MSNSKGYMEPTCSLSDPLDDAISFDLAVKIHHSSYVVGSSKSLAGSNKVTDFWLNQS